MRIVLQSVNDELPLSVLFFRNSFGFCESDEFLIKILKLAINNIEARAGISILKKEWKVVHNNYQIFLKNGPVNEVVSIKNSKGKNIVPLSTVRKQDNLLLTFEEDLGFITIYYKTGYDSCNLPECLKNNIISEFLNVYDKNEKIIEKDKNNFVLNLNNSSKIFVYG
ncbi:hypothetical protein [Alphaproteobacteria bacterium endosymbiont of Tiliacea citrago]|uniref:hypothetical protein n=1 Tax=Alphaproteobacteria bacterium endosymbiont of Tiliacea citrago TaxID=3077944 RepID=UPI00313DD495